jgi:hypothetical protein
MLSDSWRNLLWSIFRYLMKKINLFEYQLKIELIRILNEIMVNES